MIVATHMGMYMPALRPDWERCLRDGEPELQVRSRRKIDLLSLRVFMERHGLTLGPVITLPNTDYQFRAYCTRVEWGIALAQLANDIDYTKFKNTPEKKHGDKALTRCYEKMWSAIFNAFPTGSVYAKRWSKNTRTAHVAPLENRVYAEPERWTKRETRVERTETVEWKRIADMTEREFEMFMRQDEPTDADLADIERDLNETYENEIAGSLLAGPREINGHLDHTHCTHARTKNARRRCRKAWLDVKNS